MPCKGVPTVTLKLARQAEQKWRPPSAEKPVLRRQYGHVGPDGHRLLSSAFQASAAVGATATRVVGAGGGWSSGMLVSLRCNERTVNYDGTG